MKLNKEEFKQKFIESYEKLYSEKFENGSTFERYHALGDFVKNITSDNYKNSRQIPRDTDKKQVYYFSMEFLIGRLLTSNLINLDILDVVVEGLAEMGIDYYKIEEQEVDAGLGNGGLGRLAACFLDSMASLGISGHGMGIRYNYGFFKQKIEKGFQVEYPDNWLKNGYVWENRRESDSVIVDFCTEIEPVYDGNKIEYKYIKGTKIKAVPYDIPVIGSDDKTVNTLRLWSAEVLDSEEFDFDNFNKGDFKGALHEKAEIESISQILYPDDSTDCGRILRIKQQYFFVSAGLKSILKEYKLKNKPLTELDKYVAVHINDTHPSMAIPELMRILMDEEKLEWDTAWELTKKIMGYTNHTILSEALEKWPIDMFKSILPRIYIIIEEINRRFKEEVVALYGNEYKFEEVSIISEDKVKMAFLAIVGSHSVNGVAKLHTEILKNQELKRFYEIYPEKFNNKTNGITHRRWLLQSNPRLTSLLKDTIGDSFIKNPRDLEQLLKFKNDDSVKKAIIDVKNNNKIEFANYLKKHSGIVVDPNSIFDVQVKRLHAYKRQMLSVFNILDLYYRLKENPNLDIVPRTFFFGAKAAPSYVLAKETIKLINTIAYLINRDNDIKGKIKIVFLENYNVSLGENIFPAADVSEQISLATKEASGTGNMKFMMNGAVTIATEDGANVEIHEEVGDDNIVIFGMRPEEVIEYYKNKNYRSIEFYESDYRIRRIIDNMINGNYGIKTQEFKTIHDSLMDQNDEYFVLKDFNEYIEAQNKIDLLYKDRSKWSEMCLVNIAKSGVFSSDNTIKQYAKDIWKV